MAETETKVAAPAEAKPAERPSAVEAWRPLESLRREVDRLFEDLDRGFFRFPSRALAEFEPFWRRAGGPAVDIVERDKDFLVAAELPGMSEKDVELKLANDLLTIKGEKKEEKEEKREGYHLSERRVRLVRAFLPRARRCGYRQDRGELQQGRAHGHPAEEAQGDEGRACRSTSSPADCPSRSPLDACRAPGRIPADGGRQDRGCSARRQERDASPE